MAAVASVVLGVLVAALAELVMLLAILVALLAWEGALRSRQTSAAHGKG